MPIYEYRCEKCGELFEKLQKITDDPLNMCIYCDGPAHRIISQSTFILKGSGWYATDHPSKDRKRGISKEKKGTKSPSTDSKPNGKDKKEKSKDSKVAA